MKLVLHNIRSIYNVGAILRTAEGLGVEQVIFSGYTPYYNNPNLLPHLREKLNHQIAKSALGAETMVPSLAVSDLPTWLKTQNALIIGLENNLQPEELSKQLILGSEKTYETLKNRDIILILGEEVSGIPPEIRQLVDFLLEIPMHGRKESFNVSVAAAIATWALISTQP